MYIVNSSDKIYSQCSPGAADFSLGRSSTKVACHCIVSAAVSSHRF